MSYQAVEGSRPRSHSLGFSGASAESNRHPVRNAIQYSLNRKEHRMHPSGLRILFLIGVGGK